MPLVETYLTMGLDADRRDASGPITPLYPKSETECIFIERVKTKYTLKRKVTVGLCMSTKMELRWYSVSGVKT